MLFDLIYVAHALISIFIMNLLLRRFKYEEDVEEGGDRWSKPHVATLSLYSLFEVRNCLMSGTVMLDLEANSLAQIAGTYEIFVRMRFKNIAN